MPTAVLLHKDSSLRIPIDGDSSIVRSYLIEGVKPDEVDFGLYGLPSLFDPHPVFNPLVARELESRYELDNSDVVRVTIGYGFHPEEWRFGGATYETVDVEVPIVFKAERPVDGGPNLAFSDFEIAKTTETRLVIQVEWFFNNVDWGKMQAFAEQHGKVHTINDVKMLFRASGIRPIPRGGNRVTVQVSASWTYDPGTPLIANGVEAPSLLPGDLIALGNYVGPPALPAAGLMRSPYHELKLLPPAPDGNGIAQLTQRELFAEDPDGWMTLPEVPPL